MTPKDTPVRVAEFLKLMREPRVASEAARLLGWDRKTVHRWFVEMAANGVIVEAGRQKFAGLGPIPMRYVLAPEWGGPARMAEAA